MVLDTLLASALQIEGLSGHDPLPAPAANYLLACKVEGKSLRTLQLYGRVIRYYFRFARANSLPGDLAQVTPHHVRLFLLSCQGRGNGPSTLNCYYRTLRTFFHWLTDERFLAESPMATVKPPRVPKVLINPFSEEQVRSLLLLCSGPHFVDQRNRAIVLLFLDTGLRLSELAGVHLPDMNFDQETIKVSGKGGKERMVRMGKTTQKALLRYLLLRQDRHPCLWVTEERSPMRPQAIKTVIRRLCDRAGIRGPKHGAHTFRHTAALNYLRNGGGEFTLQVLLGHSTLAMTRRYVSSLGTEDMLKAHRLASPVDNLFRAK